MFLITFDIGTKQWHLDEGFGTLKEAKTYLDHKGFINKNGFYIKDYKGWFPTTRAFINKISL